MGLLTGRFDAASQLPASDVRAAQPWVSYFRDGRPAPEWLARLDAVREVPVRRRAHSRPGRTVLAAGPQPPHRADSRHPDCGAGRDSRPTPGLITSRTVAARLACGRFLDLERAPGAILVLMTATFSPGQVA